MNLENIILYTRHELNQATRKRNQETKIGEDVQLVKDSTHWEEELKISDARFVLLGIPEDIGVRANFGRGGSHTAWKPALESFLNQQSNHFLKGTDILVLGHIRTEDLMKTSEQFTQRTQHDVDALRQLVAQLDERVSQVIEKIIQTGKIPIVIGGGHNNAYGNIKGASRALNQKINVINCDPHTDFRPLEGRHSGNGFSYAFREQYLDRYSVFGMHEQYNTGQVLREFMANPQNLYFSTYEDIFVRENLSFSKALAQNIGFVKHSPCGVEIDLDAITNVPSSAKTSSGISPVQARQYIYQCGKHLSSLYLHIAEGAPILSHIKADNKTGKLIAYLISDFIKGIGDRSN
ncbi:MAG: formimidoylglutamase [Bacteroidetes bacterium]|nr:formimidoylglutamase [Bacteroidota bacterium]